MSGQVRILPLGGLGEIGKNMTVVEYDGRIVVVDTGLMFPTAEMLGIDLVLPDFSYLREPDRRHRGDRPHPRPRGPRRRAAVRPPRDRDPAGDLRRPADDRHGPLEARGAQAQGRAAARPAARRARSSAGPFEIEMIHMSHSIPDACAVAMTTPVGTILITGDYKFDQTPVDGRPGRLRAARAARRRGAALPLRRLDQRRPARASRCRRPASGRRCSRRSRAATAGSSSPASPRTSTASSRSSTPPTQLGRKVALVGRSMRKNFNIASNLGIANAPDGLLIQPREIEDYPGRGGHRDLDRQPGRAAVGAAADGPRRAPRRPAPLRRHGRLLGDAGARQRALGQRDGRPDLRDRRARHHRRRRADPRLRPRLPGGHEADAQPDPARAT